MTIYFKTLFLNKFHWIKLFLQYEKQNIQSHQNYASMIDLLCMRKIRIAFFSFHNPISVIGKISSSGSDK